MMMKAPAIAAELERAATDLREGKLASISLYWTAPGALIAPFSVGLNPGEVRPPDEDDLKYAGRLEDLAAKLRVTPENVKSIHVVWPVVDKKPGHVFDVDWTTP
jgi:hypothetical protein